MRLRLFIGVFPPVDIQREIAAANEPVAERPPGRWVSPERLHLTLCFLGDRDEARLVELTNALDRAARRQPAFELALGGLDAFPNPRRARVGFVPVREGQEPLRALAMATWEELPPEDRPNDDKPFRAHLTVARFREAPPTAAWLALESAYARQAQPWRFRVDELCLVQSVLSPSGPEYRPRHRAGLATAP